MITKIISGGQTGADAAALDAAIELNIPHGGWIPKGRKTETGPLPDKYQLQEMPTGSYTRRTEQNVIDSDVTAIFSHGRLSGGSLKTYNYAKKNNKPCLHLNMTRLSVDEAVKEILHWIEENNIQILNVAGPRGSKDPEIYAVVKEVLAIALTENLANNQHTTHKSTYYSMEYIEEDEKILILFYNDRNELVAKRELPKCATVEDYIEKNRQNR